MAIEKIDGMSMDVEQEERDKLRAVFPQCFAEGKLDIDKLLTLCGTYMDDDFEKYEFKWKGKRDCLKLAQMRSTATLRPYNKEDESVDFDTTKNLYIEGDNLEVLKLLQKAYFRRVKMIYIDPPYNTGNDFVYEDDFADTLANYKEVTSQATKSNPETMGRFHTNWLNMIYSRLRLAANLLRDDGAIFISIDDGEQANLRKIAAIAICHCVRANKLLAIPPSLLNNPLTIIPIYSLNYWVGRAIIGEPPLLDLVAVLGKIAAPPESTPETSWIEAWLEGIQHGFEELWSMGGEMLAPFCLGCGIVGSALATSSYFLTLRAVDSFRKKTLRKKQSRRITDC